MPYAARIEVRHTRGWQCQSSTEQAAFPWELKDRKGKREFGLRLGCGAQMQHRETPHLTVLLGGAPETSVLLILGLDQATYTLHTHVHSEAHVNMHVHGAGGSLLSLASVPKGTYCLAASGPSSGTGHRHGEGVLGVCE